jgi:hypothetical protein
VAEEEVVVVAEQLLEQKLAMGAVVAEVPHSALRARAEQSSVCEVTYWAVAAVVVQLMSESMAAKN